MKSKSFYNKGREWNNDWPHRNKSKVSATKDTIRMKLKLGSPGQCTKCLCTYQCQPWEFDCEVCPQGRDFHHMLRDQGGDFDHMWCPQGRSFVHKWCPQGWDFACTYLIKTWRTFDPPSLTPGWGFWPILFNPGGGEFEFENVTIPSPPHTLPSPPALGFNIDSCISLSENSCVTIQTTKIVEMSRNYKTNH